MEETMDIRIVKSELKVTASENLNIEEDLEKENASLEETLKLYGENKDEDTETA